MAELIPAVGALIMRIGLWRAIIVYNLYNYKGGALKNENRALGGSSSVTIKGP